MQKYGKCKVKNCKKTRQHKYGKYCAMHLARYRRNGCTKTQKGMGIIYNFKLSKLQSNQIDFIKKHTNKMTDIQIATELKVPFYLVRYARRKIVGRKYKGLNKKTYLKLKYRKFKNNKCEICGWNSAPCDIHHRISLKVGGKESLGNYICLCPNHHRMVHSKILKLPEVPSSNDHGNVYTS